MARVPVSQGSRVALAPLPQQNIRETDVSAVGRAFGEGAQKLGQAGMEFAQHEQRLAEIRAEEEARRLDTEHMTGLRALREKVRSARGINARPTLEQSEKELADYNSAFLARSSNPMVKGLLGQSITRRSAQEVDAWSSHAFNEESKAIDGAYSDRAEGFAETALDHADDAVIREQNFQAGVNEIQARGKWNGWDKATTEQEVAKFTTKVRVGQARQKFEADDPEGALSILDAHPDQIRDGDDYQLRRLIKNEIDQNLAETDAAVALGEAGTVEGVPTGEQAWQPPIRAQTVTVKGGQYGAKRDYGSHEARDYAGVPEGTPVYPMAEGRIRKISKSPGGGNTVEIEYAGGYRSKYLHLADGTTSHLKEGQPVTPTTQVGGVGNTGAKSKGTHLHAELTGPNGRKVDPDKVVGKSAGLPAPNGSRVDLGQAYAYIEDQPWSENRKRRAKDAVRTFASENDVVRARVEQDADRDITQALVDMNKGGKKLTAMSQLPAGALARASPSTLLQLQDQIAANNKKTAAEPNGPLMAGLTIMAAQDPNQFMGTVNPELYRGVLPDSEVMELHQMRLKLQQRTGPQPSEILTMINLVLPATGIVKGSGRAKDKKEAEAKALILRGVQKRLGALGKADIDQETILRAVRAEVTLVRPQDPEDRTLGKAIPLFEARERGVKIAVDIPPSALPVIDRNLRAMGLPVNASNRSAVYFQNQEELDALGGR